MQSEQQTAIGSTLNEQGSVYQSVAALQADIAANLQNRSTGKTNDENSPPKIVDYYIKRPKTCNLLDVSAESLINYIAEIRWNFNENFLSISRAINKLGSQRKITSNDTQMLSHVKSGDRQWSIWQIKHTLYKK